MAAPQYAQLLRALATQRLGAGDTTGSAADWQMISRSAVDTHRMSQRPGGEDPLGPAPPSRPGPYDPFGPQGIRPIKLGPLSELLRQRLAKRQIAARPRQIAEAALGSQIPTAVRQAGAGY